MEVVILGCRVIACVLVVRAIAGVVQDILIELPPWGRGLVRIGAWLLGVVSGLAGVWLAWSGGLGR